MSFAGWARIATKCSPSQKDARSVGSHVWLLQDSLLIEYKEEVSFVAAVSMEARNLTRHSVERHGHRCVGKRRLNQFSPAVRTHSRRVHWRLLGNFRGVALMPRERPRPVSLRGLRHHKPSQRVLTSNTAYQLQTCELGRDHPPDQRMWLITRLTPPMVESK